MITIKSTAQDKTLGVKKCSLFLSFRISSYDVQYVFGKAMKITQKNQTPTESLCKHTFTHFRALTPKLPCLIISDICFNAPLPPQCHSHHRSKLPKYKMSAIEKINLHYVRLAKMPQNTCLSYGLQSIRLSDLTDKSAGWFMCCTLNTSNSAGAESNWMHSLTLKAQSLKIDQGEQSPLTNEICQWNYIALLAKSRL